MIFFDEFHIFFTSWAFVEPLRLCSVELNLSLQTPTLIGCMFLMISQAAFATGFLLFTVISEALYSSTLFDAFFKTDAEAYYPNQSLQYSPSTRLWHIFKVILPLFSVLLKPPNMRTSCLATGPPSSVDQTSLDWRSPALSAISCGCRSLANRWLRPCKVDPIVKTIFHWI